MTEEIQLPQPQAIAKVDLRVGGKIEAIIPRSVDEAFRLARAYWVAGLAPDSYSREKGVDLPKDEVISRMMIGIMKGMEVGFPPITALSTIAIINRRPCIWGEGGVALIQRSGLLKSMRIEYFGTVPADETGTGDFAANYGCRVIMERLGQAEPYVGEFTVGDAKRAHLWMNTRRVPWIEYPKRQMKWRAFSFPAKDGFADCLMGISIREEVEDLPEAIERKADTSFLDDAPAALPPPSERPIVIDTQRAAEPVPVMSGEEFEAQARIIRDLATLGTAAIELHWSSLSLERQAELSGVREEVRSIASDADKVNASEVDEAA